MCIYRRKHGAFDALIVPGIPQPRRRLSHPTPTTQSPRMFSQCEILGLFLTLAYRLCNIHHGSRRVLVLPLSGTLWDCKILSECYWRECHWTCQTNFWDQPSSSPLLASRSHHICTVSDLWGCRTRRFEASVWNAQKLERVVLNCWHEPDTITETQRCWMRNTVIILLSIKSPKWFIYFGISNYGHQHYIPVLPPVGLQVRDKASFSGHRVVVKLDSTRGGVMGPRHHSAIGTASGIYFACYTHWYGFLAPLKGKSWSSSCERLPHFILIPGPRDCPIYLGTFCGRTKDRKSPLCKTPISSYAVLEQDICALV